MRLGRLYKSWLLLAGASLMILFLASTSAIAGNNGRGIFVLTSTNSSRGNDVLVFKLDTMDTASLSLFKTLPTGGTGGASTNAGILQFKNDVGAVANYGSNTVSQIVRYDDFFSIGQSIPLVTGCMKPDLSRLQRIICLSLAPVAPRATNGPGAGWMEPW